MALLQRLIFGSCRNVEASLQQPRATRVMLKLQSERTLIATVLKQGISLTAEASHCLSEEADAAGALSCLLLGPGKAMTGA